MTSRRLIDVDPVQMKETWSIDNEDGTAGIENVWQTDELLDMNRRELNDGGWDRNGPDLVKVASIPFAVFEKWRTERGYDAMAGDADPAELAKLLNDSDWSKLRTRKGRI